MAWDGSDWRIVPSPNASVQSNVLYSVSCSTPSFCMAVGVHFIGSTLQALVLVWDGSSWTIDSGLDDDSMYRSLSSVSCISVSMCVGVGTHSPGAMQTMVALWNGSSWSIQSDPTISANTLSAVTCILPGVCTFVGPQNDATPGTVADQRTAVVTWNGQYWNAVPSPNAGSSSNMLAAVSCASVTSCVAVGEYLAGTVEKTLALSLSSPDPSEPPIGGPGVPMAPAFTG